MVSGVFNETILNIDDKSAGKLGVLFSAMDEPFTAG